MNSEQILPTSEVCASRRSREAGVIDSAGKGPASPFVTESVTPAPPGPATNPTARPQYELPDGRAAPSPPRRPRYNLPARCNARGVRTLSRRSSAGKKVTADLRRDPGRCAQRSISPRVPRRATTRQPADHRVNRDVYKHRRSAALAESHIRADADPGRWGGCDQLTAFGRSGNALNRTVRRLEVSSAWRKCTIESTWSANLLSGNAAISASNVSSQSAITGR